MTPRVATAERARTALLAVLLAGSAGTLVELWLIEHLEDWWQLLPLVLLGAVLVAGFAVLVRAGRATLLGFRAVMVVAAISGFVGQYLHYTGNAEFEREIFPELGGVELFAESMSGATPVLAPGTMTVIGLLGLIYAWGHPGLGEKAQPSSSTSRDRTATSE